LSFSKADKADAAIVPVIEAGKAEGGALLRRYRKGRPPKNSTIAIEQETILASRAIILLQLPTFLGSNWGDLV
jgi:hypothetical protein